MGLIIGHGARLQIQGKTVFTARWPLWRRIAVKIGKWLLSLAPDLTSLGAPDIACEIVGREKPKCQL